MITNQKESIMTKNNTTPKPKKVKELKKVYKLDFSPNLTEWCESEVETHAGKTEIVISSYEHLFYMSGSPSIKRIDPKVKWKPGDKEGRKRFKVLKEEFEIQQAEAAIKKKKREERKQYLQSIADED